MKLFPKTPGQFFRTGFFCALSSKKFFWCYATIITCDLLFFVNTKFSLGTNCQSFSETVWANFKQYAVKVSKTIRLSEATEDTQMTELCCEHE